MPIIFVVVSQNCEELLVLRNLPKPVEDKKLPRKNTWYHESRYGFQPWTYFATAMRNFSCVVRIVTKTNYYMTSFIRMVASKDHSVAYSNNSFEARRTCVYKIRRTVSVKVSGKKKKVSKTGHWSFTFTSYYVFSMLRLEIKWNVPDISLKLLHPISSKLKGMSLI